MIAIVSHDAGGAEILSSWVKFNINKEYLFVLGGPAVNIFNKKIGHPRITNLIDAIEAAEIVICGTSWESELEKKAIILSKSKNKKVVAFIDHWVNYAERFMIGTKSVIPDEIWVGDKYALSIAKNTFLNSKIVLVNNPYILELKDTLFRKKLSNDLQIEDGTILYVCEPIREHALKQYGDENYWGYSEENALIFFMQNIEHLGKKINKIILRPHPSEKAGKYNWALNKYSNIAIENSKNLLEQILESDIIVGCESMAMVVGLLAKKRVISSIPFGGKKCGLPHQEIEHLQDLIRKVL